MNRRRLVISALTAGAAAALAVGLVAGPSPAASSPQGSTSTTTTSTTKLTSDQVTQVALQVAALAGDPSPRSIQHVEAIRGDAVLASSGDVLAESARGEDVYLVALDGQFSASFLPKPPGAPVRTGSVMTLVLDASTGRITDVGIKDNTPDLASLGEVTVDR
jgi:hypothetical protein